MHKILMVEDDMDFAQIMVECLQEDPQFLVEDVINNVADARDKFDAGLLRDVDVVLIDLHLARSRHDSSVNSHGGVELIREMRTRHQFKGTVIVVTNSNLQSDGQDALRAGCDGYLCKHLRLSDLPALLSELRMAIRGDVVLVSKEMRHIFMRSPDSASTGMGC
jgi:CheY-like chemotaxis protein